MNANTMPTLFLSHGSPMTALEPREAGAFWQRLGPTLEARFGRPRAILAVSAHSLSREPVLLAAARHEAVYDFGGFDPRLHTLRYDAPGAPALAARVQALLQAAGLPAHLGDEGGLDHGIWVPLRAMFPDAGIAVLPLAWPPQWTPGQLFALGEALAPLAAEGVLIVGSGHMTHNLGEWLRGGTAPNPRTADFRDWVHERLLAGDSEALLDWARAAPHAAFAHPTPEHFLPLFVALGAAGEGHATEWLGGGHVGGLLAADNYLFAPATPADAAGPGVKMASTAR
jgi:4,5-DOPA dioxygenase extradiol